MKFLVKREDTGRVARIELKEDQQVYDLLEASLVPLKFDKDAILCVYADKDNNVLGEATLLSEVKNIEMFVVKDKLMESKTKPGGQVYLNTYSYLFVRNCACVQI